MWLYLITIVAGILGLAAAFAGLGPIAIILVVGAVAMLAGRIFVSSRHGGANPGAATAAPGGTMSSTGGRSSAVAAGGSRVERSRGRSSSGSCSTCLLRSYPVIT